MIVSHGGTFVTTTNRVVSAGGTTSATIGGHLGGGFDLHVSRSFSLGLGVGYNAMANFSPPIGGFKNFNGVQVSIGIGWLFGAGYPPP